MPYVGQASFLRIHDVIISPEDTLCQCPMSGKPHFYCTVRCSILSAKIGVNALCRASLISTLPFKENVLSKIIYRYYDISHNLIFSTIPHKRL